MGAAAKDRNRMSVTPFQLEGQLEYRNPEYALSSTSRNAPDSRERLLPGILLCCGLRWGLPHKLLLARENGLAPAESPT